MYNTYSFNKKANVLKDEDRKFKRESIIKKDSREPEWVHGITSRVLADSDKALASGNTVSIERADNNLSRWDNELTQLNEMTLDRKNQEHVKTFVTDSYPSLKINSPVNFEPKVVTEKSKVYSSADDYISSLFGRNFGKASAENVKQAGFSIEAPATIAKMSATSSKPKFDFNGSSGNAKSPEEIWKVEETTPNTPNEALIVASQKDDEKAEEEKKQNELEDRNWKIWADSTYLTTKDDDFSSNYGTTIQRQEGYRGDDSDLGQDTLESRKKASQVIVDNKDTIVEVGKKYGVNPAILASCIFTEQACNVNLFEGVVDTVRGAFISTTSVGVSQIQIKLAMELDKTYMKEPIEFAGYSSKDFYKWRIPGESGDYVGTYRGAVVKRLNNPEQNIEYAAAYLASIQDAWKGAYPKIDGDTAIEATLYNIGLGTSDPHGNPQPNDFGRYARANYFYMESLLGLSAE